VIRPPWIYRFDLVLRDDLDTREIWWPNNQISFCSSRESSRGKHLWVLRPERHLISQNLVKTCQEVIKAQPPLNEEQVSQQTGVGPSDLVIDVTHLPKVDERKARAQALLQALTSQSNTWHILHKLICSAPLYHNKTDIRKLVQLLFSLGFLIQYYHTSSYNPDSLVQNTQSPDRI